jgi:hypothetical protein
MPQRNGRDFLRVSCLLFSQVGENYDTRIIKVTVGTNSDSIQVLVDCRDVLHYCVSKFSRFVCDFQVCCFYLHIQAAMPMLLSHVFFRETYC